MKNHATVEVLQRSLRQQPWLQSAAQSVQQHLLLRCTSRLLILLEGKVPLLHAALPQSYTINRRLEIWRDSKRERNRLEKNSKEENPQAKFSLSLSLVLDFVGDPLAEHQLSLDRASINAKETRQMDDASTMQEVNVDIGGILLEANCLIDILN
jgi:hypothetical protein